LILHLERKNQWDKDIDTIDKLFSSTHEAYIPQNVIGIQNVSSASKITNLNNLVVNKNEGQQSNVLMVYCFYDHDNSFDRVWAYFIPSSGPIEVRRPIRTCDNFGSWNMCFDEEYEDINNNSV